VAEDVAGREPQEAAHLALIRVRLPVRRVVRAAGGVLRRERDGRVEIAVVHRPRHGDWTLPKGKLDPGESWIDAAVREVEEETGFRCRAVRRVGTTRYRDARGRPKVVRYWLMELADGETGTEFRPNREVDELRWCPPETAEALLTYPHDRALVGRALARYGSRP
jgi:8-oxo-dGTP diphosphatase